MKAKIVRLWSLLLAVAMPFGAAANAGTATQSDSPALGAAGPHKVGFRRIAMNGLPDLASGASRTLPLAIWYPTSAQRGRLACYRRPMQSAGGSIPAGLPKEMGDCGRAIDQGAPLVGKAAPVVILSHGLNGWATGWSILGENLASKGYIVIATDHLDLDVVAGGGDGRSFRESLLRRPIDQRAVLKALADKSPSLPAWLHAISQGDQVALMGYSMGGYGALVAAGAGISPQSAVAGFLPPAGVGPLLAGNETFEAQKPVNLRALVLFAPFGGGAPLRVWTPEALANIKVDTLFISGDQDDIINHSGGVRWLFESMSGANRNLLTYQNARHNIAMDPTPSQVRHLFIYRERFEEPVWRSDRIQSINAHMITAFLDKTMGNNSLGDAHLAVPVPRAIDGQWPLAPNTGVGAATATLADQPAHWPGFQRRWAVGLEFERKTATPKP